MVITGSELRQSAIGFLNSASDARINATEDLENKVDKRYRQVLNSEHYLAVSKNEDSESKEYKLDYVLTETDDPIDIVVNPNIPIEARIDIISKQTVLMVRCRSWCEGYRVIGENNRGDKIQQIKFDSAEMSVLKDKVLELSNAPDELERGKDISQGQ